MRKNKICSLSTKQTFYRKNKDNNDDRVNKPYPRKRKKKICNVCYRYYKTCFNITH